MFFPSVEDVRVDSFVSNALASPTTGTIAGSILIELSFILLFFAEVPILAEVP